MKGNMKKITILSLHTKAGGVERAVASLANLLCTKYRVEIAVVYKLQEFPAFSINEKVSVVYLSNNLTPNKAELLDSIKKRKIIKIFKEARKSFYVLLEKRRITQKFIEKSDSDVFVSTGLYFNKLLGKYGKNVGIKIAQEHNHHNNNMKYIKRVLKSLKKIDYFMPVSYELSEFYKIKLEHKKTKVKYISHFLDYQPQNISKLNKKNLLWIGRLSQEKGVYDLLSIFCKIQEMDNECKLHIVGDGDLYNNMTEKAKELNISNNVTFHGTKNRPEIEQLMLSSFAYVMTSYSESFGLVLIEAASYGLPLIAFDDAKGANEIIDSNMGFLIENRNIDEFANKVMLLLKDKNLRKKMGEHSLKKSYEYNSLNAEKKWFEFLEQIL